MEGKCCIWNEIDLDTTLSPCEQFRSWTRHRKIVGVTLEPDSTWDDRSEMTSRLAGRVQFGSSPNSTCVRRNVECDENRGHYVIRGLGQTRLIQGVVCGKRHRCGYTDSRTRLVVHRTSSGQYIIGHDLLSRCHIWRDVVCQTMSYVT